MATLTAAFQRRVLVARLAECGGNGCAAARSLGIHRNTFTRIMGGEQTLSVLAVRRRLRASGRVTGPLPLPATRGRGRRGVGRDEVKRG